MVAKVTKYRMQDTMFMQNYVRKLCTFINGPINNVYPKKYVRKLRIILNGQT